MKVVIVDDGPEIARLLSLILRQDGVETIEWTDHFDAITRQVDWDNINVVIVDQLLGIYDGKQLLKWLAKEFPHVRRIMLTGDSRVDINLAYAHTVLIKPTPPDVIREAVYDR